MNQELHPGAEGLAQVQQVAGDADEQALLVHLGFAHGLQKFTQVGDFPPVHHHDIDLALFERSEGGRVVGGSFTSYAQLGKHPLQRLEKVAVVAQNQCVDVES